MVGGVRFGSGGARAGVDGGGAPPSLLCRVPSAEVPHQVESHQVLIYL